MSDRLLVIFPFLALMIGVALEALFAGVFSSRAKGWLAFLSGLTSLAGVVAAWPGVVAGRVVDVRFGTWDGPIQLAYHLDGLSLMFALMGAGIGTAVLLYAVTYMDREKGTTRFFSLILIFIAGLIHLVYTADLFIFYLNWELVGLCSFLLVGFWYNQPEAAYGARKVFTITHLAGYGLLAGVLLLFHRTGSTLWTDPKVQGALTTGIFLLMIVSAVAKSVQFPLNTWIPFAMFAPTPVSALLHAACYVKAGVYLIARLHSMGAWPESWSAIVSIIGAITLLTGALFALAQKDLKRLLAYSTISQIGYMVLGLGIGTPLAIAAGLFHCLNHGLFKGSLFLCAGSVQHACGTRDMDRLGGLGRRMPGTMAIWLVASASIAGLPLLNGFVSKWLLFNAALEARQPLLALVPWIGSVLTLFYFLKATSGVFLGSDGDATEHAHEASWQMLAGSGVLAAACLVLGVAPQLAIKYVLNPLLPALGVQPLAGVSWFGFTAGQGAWYATGGLALSLIALSFGAIVYWLPLAGSRTALATAGGAPSIFTGGEPLASNGHLGAADFSSIVQTNLRSFYNAFDVDRYWLALWRGLCRLALRLESLASALESKPVAGLTALAALVAAAASLVSPLHESGAATAVLPLSGLAASVGIALAGLLLASAAAKATRAYLPVVGGGGNFRVRRHSRYGDSAARRLSGSRLGPGSAGRLAQCEKGRGAKRISRGCAVIGRRDDWRNRSRRTRQPVARVDSSPARYRSQVGTVSALVLDSFTGGVRPGGDRWTGNRHSGRGGVRGSVNAARQRTGALREFHAMAYAGRGNGPLRRSPGARPARPEARAGILHDHRHGPADCRCSARRPVRSRSVQRWERRCTPWERRCSLRAWPVRRPRANACAMRVAWRAGIRWRARVS